MTSPNMRATLPRSVMSHASPTAGPQLLMPVPPTPIPSPCLATISRAVYRADVAAYRPQRNGTLGHTVVFECKQSAPDLRRDDRRSQEMLARLESV